MHYSGFDDFAYLYPMNRLLRLLLPLALLALCLQQPIFGAAGAQAGKIGTPAARWQAGHEQLDAFGLINMNGRMPGPGDGKTTK